MPLTSRGYAPNTPSLHTSVRKSSPNRPAARPAYGSRNVPSNYTYRSNTRNWPLLAVVLIGLVIMGFTLMPTILDAVSAFNTVGDSLGGSTATTTP